MPPPRPPPHPPRSRGGVSWVTLTLMALAIGGGYLGWVWIPVYLVHYEVKQVVRSYVNLALKDQNDEKLVQDLVHKLRVLDQVEVPGEDGGRVKVPAVDVAAQDVTWERDRETRPNTLHVAFEYTRQVELPFLRRWTEKVFSVDVVDDLAMPDWGPAR